MDDRVSLSTVRSKSLTCTGVTDIETNVAAKSVVVTHADGVSSSEMLEKLTKVRTCVLLV
jgi:hypothetical protein